VPVEISSTPGGAGLGNVEYEMFRQLICRRFGIDYAPNKRDLLASRLAQRLEVLGLRSYVDYYRSLRYGDENEWDALAEVLTNHETYFFRQSRQFEALAEVVAGMRRAGRHPVRALSAGCSTGEEAFSMAAVLAEVPGMPASGFEVVGVDISTRCIDSARRAEYHERSFRSEESRPGAWPLERHFERSGTRYRVRTHLRERVQFERRNLAAPAGLGLGCFDVVFCRNVLIYVDEGSMERMLGNLRSSMQLGSCLFLGHSESLLARSTVFRPVRVREQFAYVVAT
jgi:chemotaxis protein methyltransferase CheR